MHKTKYIFVTGGVCSSLGKGLTAASVGMLLERKGLKVSLMKLDPYLNVDPGTMSPFQHGEVYVTDDGAETDLDLGHYHRYTDSPLSRASNTTTGQVYQTVIRQERRGDYLGKTVQVIPHVTDEIKKRIRACAAQNENTDVVIVEIGGTIGDIELLPFLEAIRQFRQEQYLECLNLHLTYVPYLKAAGEVKTKPTQHSVQQLQQIGIFADIILCRCEEPLEDDVKDKISLFCNVKKECVVDEPDVKYSIYEVPSELHKQRLDNMICEKLGLADKEIDLSDWDQIVNTIRNPKGTITIGIVGKYVEHQDAYKSVFEALDHGAIAAGYKLEIRRLEAGKIFKDGALDESFYGCDGYLVPGGFGERGWRGKMLATQYCRQEKVPYFAICLGMQMMAIEFARNVLDCPDASSTEIDPATPDPVISLLSEQRNVEDLGGTMRLGAYSCRLKPGSHVHKAYGQEVISERHRHRFEFNGEYRDRFESNGMLVTGTLENGTLCEILEVKDHPWMVGVQFHPEFKSKPNAPHPLFRDFIRAVVENRKT